MIYRCCDTSRRAVLESQTVYNGIDWLDVSSDQTVLTVHFFNAVGVSALGVGNVVIEGGERVTNIQVTSVVDGATLSPPLIEMVCASPLSSPPDGSNILVVTVSSPGDFTEYTLRLVASPNDHRPPPYFDPVYSSIEFSFKVGCTSPFDCQQEMICPPEVPVQPSFSYQAKDYASFRSLMLDRMSTIIPAWQERSPADLGIVLVELLAYVGDYLSYQQDAVATEAYLGTARRRTSVRRHVKLVDYPMLDGRNARAWIHFDVNSDYTLSRTATVAAGAVPAQILTQSGTSAALITIGSTAYALAMSQSPQVFELMEDAALFAAHNAMPLYTWGDHQCCLPQGATEAWLQGSLPHLAAGMVVIFQEVLGPETGAPEDADVTHRWAVRLTEVTPAEDPIGGLFLEPALPVAVSLTKIAWGAADALPFPICVSSKTSGADARYLEGVSVVLGNNALADCGRTILNEQLDTVPQPNPALEPVTVGCDPCAAPAPVPPPRIRYTPQLAQGPLTFADAYEATAAATTATNARVLDGLVPAITLNTGPGTDTWVAQLDLLESAGDVEAFVAETEDDGTATLRFGDGTFGKQVIAGDTYYAQYRVGGDRNGNVGHDTLCTLASADASVLASGITAVTNPLPAVGGLDPETLDSVRSKAPYAFNTQERAVTAADYGTMAVQVDPALNQARGTFRWTGSWYTVFIAADPNGGGTLTPTQQSNLVGAMEPYRTMGHDLDVDAPVYVSLELVLEVCAAPGYLAPDVQAAILQVLSNHALPDGSCGLFAPENFGFGQTVYLSPIIAAVQQVQGVSSLTVQTFQRQGQPTTSGLATGAIPLQSLEIARLDNDPDYPEHGVLTVHVCGGN